MSSIKSVAFNIGDKVRIVLIDATIDDKIYVVIKKERGYAFLDNDGTETKIHQTRVIEIVDSKKSEDTKIQGEHWVKEPKNNNDFTRKQSIVSHVIIDKANSKYYYYNTYNGEHSEKSVKSAVLSSYDTKVKKLKAKGYVCQINTKHTK